MNLIDDKNEKKINDLTVQIDKTIGLKNLRQSISISKIVNQKLIAGLIDEHSLEFKNKFSIHNFTKAPSSVGLNVALESMDEKIFEETNICIHSMMSFYSDFLRQIVSYCNEIQYKKSDINTLKEKINFLFNELKKYQFKNYPTSVLGNFNDSISTLLDQSLDNLKYLDIVKLNNEFENCLEEYKAQWMDYYNNIFAHDERANKIIDIFSTSLNELITLLLNSFSTLEDLFTSQTNFNDIENFINVIHSSDIFSTLKVSAQRSILNEEDKSAYVNCKFKVIDLEIFANEFLSNKANILNKCFVDDKDLNNTISLLNQLSLKFDQLKNNSLNNKDINMSNLTTLKNILLDLHNLIKILFISIQNQDKLFKIIFKAVSIQNQIAKRIEER